MGESEKTEAGETLAAAMGRELAEVAADLPRRRQAVKAEVLAEILEEIDHLEASHPERAASVGLTGYPEVRSGWNMETYFIRSAARSALVAVNLAMQRGAGVLVEAPQDLPGQARLDLPPPGTPESLGDAL